MATHETPFGTVIREEGCHDDYERLYTYDQPPLGSGVIVLQRAAVRSFQRAEEAYARRLWRLGWPRKVTLPIDDKLWRGDFARELERREFRPIILTGSIRSCATQTRLWRSDNKRFAAPGSTLHPHGLAIDVSTFFLNATIRALLLNHGWRQSRPDDEPWHFSFTGTWMQAA